MTTQIGKTEPKKDQPRDATDAAPVSQDNTADGAHGAAEARKPKSPPRRRRRPAGAERGRDTKRQVRDLCIAAAPAAMKRLINSAIDPLTPDAIANPQCREILDRAVGPMREPEPAEQQQPAELDLSDVPYHELQEYERVMLKLVSRIKKPESS